MVAPHRCVLAAVVATLRKMRKRTGVNAASLSGGEQRTFEIARTLMMDPKLIMLDEPSIGLAPRIVDQVFAVVRRLAETGKAILMVEQNCERVCGWGTRIRT
jgi:branched-chain amino acid transport system ATP-binding protein